MGDLKNIIVSVKEKPKKLLGDSIIWLSRTGEINLTEIKKNSHFLELTRWEHKRMIEIVHNFVFLQIEGLW